MESQTRDAYVVNQDRLAVTGEFEGHEHGGTGISMIFVDAPPATGRRCTGTTTTRSSSCRRDRRR